MSTMYTKRSATKCVGLLSGAIVMALAGSTCSFADTVLYELTTGNSAISGYTGPYASVEVDLTSSTMATITFTSLTNGGNIYLLGDGGTVGVNVNATSWSLGTITGSNAGTGFTPGAYSSGGSGNEDGFGSFNQTINTDDGYTHSSDTVSFILTDTSGTWAAAANVLAANASGDVAAGHIFITTSPANAANGAIVTGFAASDGTPVVTPLPSAAFLFGSVLVGGIGISGWRKRRGRRGPVSAFA